MYFIDSSASKQYSQTAAPSQFIFKHMYSQQGKALPSSRSSVQRKHAKAHLQSHKSKPPTLAVFPVPCICGCDVSKFHMSDYVDHRGCLASHWIPAPPTRMHVATYLLPCLLFPRRQLPSEPITSHEIFLFSECEFHPGIYFGASQPQISP